MGYNLRDNLVLPADKWVKITELSGVHHFKYDPSTVIYIYEGHGHPPTDLPNPDLRDPITILSGGENSKANKVGKSMIYRNRVGALWAYSERNTSYVLKVNTDGQ